MWEAESLLMTSQNNTIRTDYVKVKIDDTQENSKCRWCRERDKQRQQTSTEGVELDPLRFVHKLEFWPYN